MKKPSSLPKTTNIETLFTQIILAYQQRETEFQKTIQTKDKQLSKVEKVCWGK